MLAMVGALATFVSAEGSVELKPIDGGVRAATLTAACCCALPGRRAARTTAACAAPAPPSGFGARLAGAAPARSLGPPPWDPRLGSRCCEAEPLSGRSA